jgi:hypothetical protein
VRLTSRAPNPYWRSFRAIETVVLKSCQEYIHRPMQFPRCLSPTTRSFMDYQGGRYRDVMFALSRLQIYSEES